MLVGKNHELEIQIDSRTAIVESNPLRFRLTVEYDAGDILDKLIAQLGAARFEEREKAEQEIRNIMGPGLWSHLIQSKDKTDVPEIRLRLLKIVQSLEEPLPAAPPER